ncbi:MAG TPA: RNA 2',3'-cyclic phosphodiesterase [Burkholderiales bacterium]
MPSSRHFFAAWPPAATAAALEAWARNLEGRVTPAQKIHLTLAFLGPVAPEKAIDAARSTNGRAHALPLEKAQYWKHSRIIWAGPRETPAALAALAEALHGALRRAGYTLEERPFAAHVTLLRSAPPPCELPPLPGVEWPVSEFTLVRSAVSNKGSAYEIVQRFAL